ncbi:MAG: hypothetical protein ACPGVO_19550 [Spirulinaceae cyanobacterium]
MGFDGHLDLSLFPAAFSTPSEVEVQKKCVRNRKRSKRRAIYCPEHGCYLDSVSQKYSLYTESADVLRSRGLNRFSALTLIATHTTVLLTGEWLEQFWCPECEDTEWYHVKRVGDRNYELRRAPQTLWLQATGVINPAGNPSVGQFTRRQARAQGKIRDFGLCTTH